MILPLAATRPPCPLAVARSALEVCDGSFPWYRTAAIPSRSQVQVSLQTYAEVELPEPNPPSLPRVDTCSHSSQIASTSPACQFLWQHLSSCLS